MRKLLFCALLTALATTAPTAIAQGEPATGTPAAASSQAMQPANSGGTETKGRKVLDPLLQKSDQISTGEAPMPPPPGPLLMPRQENIYGEEGILLSPTGTRGLLLPMGDFELPQYEPVSLPQGLQDCTTCAPSRFGDHRRGGPSAWDFPE